MLLKFDQNIKFHTKQGEEKYFTHTKIVCLDFFFLFCMGALSNMVLFFYFLAKVISLDSQQFFFLLL